MKKITYLVLSAVVVTTPQFVVAANIPMPSPQGLPDDSIVAVLGKVTQFVTGLIAVLAILMIVISGIMYITSAGDSTKVSQAKDWLTYSVVGLVVSLLGYVIVVAVGSALGAW